ncbi:Oidioi.mRNA.OKI2018_I69.XSR.g13578.t1.cds [Oikopleura dioica]|uniref:Oidioi.mRNA.OKI2018_I69.XSR.g13578.t1.cds n=1 Tax=Oikopleura dioica TaxID=34765 RepID=A0ABN7SC00_OIKDI|nr:Oidioi.mRNA.OKI2018_I69.XSR.g13578.t1.cds [Oikopleura dioica]
MNDTAELKETFNNSFLWVMLPSLLVFFVVAFIFYFFHGITLTKNKANRASLLSKRRYTTTGTPQYY